MLTQIIYDNKGEIIRIVSGTILPPEPEGVPCIVQDIDSNSIVEKVDVTTTPHTLILKDRPKTTMDSLRDEVLKCNTIIEDLKNQLLDTQEFIVEMQYNSLINQ